MEDANCTPKNYEWRGRLPALFDCHGERRCPPAGSYQTKHWRRARWVVHDSCRQREGSFGGGEAHTPSPAHAHCARARLRCEAAQTTTPPTDAPAQRAQNFWPRIHVAPSDYMALTRGGELCNAEGHLGPDEFEAAMREQIRQYIQGQLANTEQRR